MRVLSSKTEVSQHTAHAVLPVARNAMLDARSKPTVFDGDFLMVLGVPRIGELQHILNVSDCCMF